MLSDPQQFLFTTSTSLSSSSSNASSRHNSTDDIYLDSVHKVELGQRRNRKVMRVKSYSIDRGFESVTEEPFEKDDRDEDLRKSLPHVRMINDYQEFSSKISISQERKKANHQKKYRRRSCSPTNRGLPRVEEECTIEDEELRSQFMFKLGMMLDKNEFNKKYNRLSKSFIQKNEKKESSYNVNSQPILEDLRENIGEKIEGSQFNSQICKLKVDEVDDINIIQEKKWNIESTEAIPEEKTEEEPANRELEIFKQGRQNHLLTGQRDFIKKILKGELISLDEQILKSNQDYQDYDWQSLIQEAGSSCSSDSDEIKTKKKQNQMIKKDNHHLKLQIQEIQINQSIENAESQN